MIEKKILGMCMSIPQDYQYKIPVFHGTRNSKVYNIRKLAKMILENRRAGRVSMIPNTQTELTEFQKNYILGDVEEWRDKDKHLRDAARLTSDKKVAKLISEGADVNSFDRYGVTALMIAAAYGRNATVRRLIAAGAHLNERDHIGVTALMYTIKGPDYQMNPDPRYGMEKAHTATLKILIKAGADVNIKEEDYGYTPLMMAIEGKEGDTVKILIKAGANVNLPRILAEGSLQTPLMLAERVRANDIVQQLRAAGAR